MPGNYLELYDWHNTTEYAIDSNVKYLNLKTGKIEDKYFKFDYNEFGDSFDSNFDLLLFVHNK